MTKTPIPPDLLEKFMELLQDGRNLDNKTRFKLYEECILLKHDVRNNNKFMSKNKAIQIANEVQRLGRIKADDSEITAYINAEFS